MEKKDKTKLVHDEECIRCENLLKKPYSCKGHPQSIKKGECVSFIERKK